MKQSLQVSIKAGMSSQLTIKWVFQVGFDLYILTELAASKKQEPEITKLAIKTVEHNGPFMLVPKPCIYNRSEQLSLKTLKEKFHIPSDAIEIFSHKPYGGIFASATATFNDQSDSGGAKLGFKPA